MLYYLSMLMLFLSVQAVLGQSTPETCRCLDPEATSTSWGAFRPTGICVGCPGSQPGTRPCFANLNGNILLPTVCEVEMPCSGCLGTWNQWSHIGICSESCEQLQARYCFRSTALGNTRSVNCNGANGATEQNRTLPCFHGNCNPQKPDTLITTTTSRIRITTTSATEMPIERITSTESKTPLPEGFRSTARPTLSNEEETQNGNQLQPITESSQAQEILLPAILGSVGILGFAAIAITISIMWSKKKRPGTEYPTYTSGTGTTTTTATVRNDNYESVGPPLPYRTGPPTMVLPTPEQPQNVANMLYQPMSGFETLPASESTTSKTDSGTYLIPIDPPENQDPESIYSHIAEDR